MAWVYIFHLLLLIKDLFIRMDIYRARDILSSKLQRKPLNIGINRSGHEPFPMDKPVHYAKYLTCQHQEFQQTSFLPVTDRDRIAEEGQVRIEGKLEHPYSAFGLFVISDGDDYHHQTGVIVHSKYAIITYSHPFQLDQGSSATFYPAINENTYRQEYRVNSLVHDKKNDFALIGLDTVEDLSQIYGKVDIEVTTDRRGGRQQYRERRRGRGYARRRDNDYHRQAPQHPVILRYKILDGKIMLTSIPKRQDRYSNLPEKGFIVQFDDEERMIIKSVINESNGNFISQLDLKALEERVSSEPKVLSCEKMDLTRHQFIWIAQRKWDEAAQISMTYNQIGEEFCSYLQNANWNNIKGLNLSLNPIRDKGVYYLTKIEMPALEELELRNCKIGNEGCKWLSKGNWQHLRALNIRTNGISQEGCKWLKEANWPQLKELNLKKNSIGRGCEYLATARWSLEVIQLGRCLVDDKGCKAISHSNWPSLTFLGLQENIISNTGAKWLSKGNWKALKFLLLRDNDNITKKGYDYLTKANAYFLYKLSITSTSYFPQNIQKLFKGDFPFLCKMHVIFFIIAHPRRRDREDQYDVEKQVRGVEKIMMDKYRHCRMLENEQYDDEDW